MSTWNVPDYEGLEESLIKVLKDEFNTVRKDITKKYVDELSAELLKIASKFDLNVSVHRTPLNNEIKIEVNVQLVGKEE
jgi:hypothetical protein